MLLHQWRTSWDLWSGDNWRSDRTGDLGQHFWVLLVSLDFFSAHQLAGYKPLFFCRSGPTFTMALLMNQAE